jgi:hypothetical protein
MEKSCQRPREHEVCLIGSAVLPRQFIDGGFDGAAGEFVLEDGWTDRPLKQNFSTAAANPQ